jgi:hypothetical protein
MPGDNGERIDGGRTVNRTFHLPEKLVDEVNQGALEAGMSTSELVSAGIQMYFDVRRIEKQLVDMANDMVEAATANAKAKESEPTPEEELVEAMDAMVERDNREGNFFDD